MTRRKIMVAHYRGEELSASFTQTFEWDNGGREYPSEWVPCHNIECTSVELLGKEVDYSALPDAAQQAISALADECEWENE